MTWPSGRVKAIGNRIMSWVARIKRDLVALYLAGRDRRTPILARVLAIVVVAYALSPIDLIPDFIPVIGWLDDLFLVPLGLAIAIRLIPPPLMETFRQEAALIAKPGKSRVAGIAIVTIWLIAAVAVWVGYAFVAGS